MIVVAIDVGMVVVVVVVDRFLPKPPPHIGRFFIGPKRPAPKSLSG